MSLLEWCQWLQHSTLGTGIRESGYAYPLIEGTHVLGLALSVGYTASTLAHRPEAPAARDGGVHE